MRIVIVYRYFWPDQTPYAALLREMIPWLVEAGHQVTIVTAQPSQGGEPRPSRETLFGAEIIRLKLLSENGSRLAKAVNGAVFSFRAFFRLLFLQRYDLYWTGTMPPVIQAALFEFCARLRGGKFLYQMQDIYPEIALVSGQMKSGIIARFMRWLDNRVINHADVVTVLSEDMKETLLRRPTCPRRLEIINNFALINPDAQPQEKSEEGGPVRFVFAGNIGNYQHLEWILDGFLSYDSSKVTLDMLGDGAVRSRLQTRAEHAPNIRFHGMKESDEAFEFMTGCDVGIVSLAKGLYALAYPAKTHTYLAAGLRVFAVIEPESRLARSITDNGLGECVSSDVSMETLHAAIGRLINNSVADEKALRRSRAIYHPDSARQKWQELLSSINRP